MVFEAGSELKLVTDGVVTVTTFVVFVDTDAGVGEVTFAPSVYTVKQRYSQSKSKNLKGERSCGFVQRDHLCV